MIYIIIIYIVTSTLASAQRNFQAALKLTRRFARRRFTKDFYVGSTQNAKDSISATSTAGFVQVEVATVSTAGANVYNYRSTGDVLPVTTWNAGTSTCENALKSLCYEVTYNDVFNIIAVTARLEVEDIVESSSAEYVDQEFSVEFSMYGAPNTARR